MPVRPPLSDAMEDGAVGPPVRPAAGALVVAQVACLPFALWHGARATTDGATTLSVVEGAREGLYWLHDGTLACPFTTALSLVSLASSSSLTESRPVGPETATRYLQDLTHGGHDGVLIGTGLLACALGGAAAGRVPTAGHER